ncbi:hypothetical protein, partial [Spartinivicinus poritis]|nr:hypothetical protein [Spartinivicinus sp. A2-2]
MKYKKLIVALGLTSALPMVHANAEQNEILSYSYTYDTHGQVKTVDGPRKDVEDITTYDYEQGNLTKVTNALGHTTESKDFHDYYGLPQTLIDVNGIVTKLAYDEQGRLKTSTLKSSAGDLTTTYVYDDATGLVTKINRPDGTETNYEYDAFFRLKATYNGLGERIEYELDDMGNITKQTIKYMNGTIAKQHRQVFDELGRIIESVSANGKKTTFTYDPNSNRLSIINPLKRTSGQAF